MNFRSDIQGLRGISVLAVLIFHFDEGILPAGFLGVDVFFVISGFLITLKIQDAINNNNFNIWRFYRDRFYRLIPSLLFVLILSSIFSVILLDYHEIVRFCKSLLSSIFFYSNMFFWKEINYFNPNAANNPLLHTWSLSVEEQFYLIFPFILLVLKNTRDKLRIQLLFIVMFISLTSACLASSNFPVANYYLLPFRFWEILVGVICAQIYLIRNDIYKFNIRITSDIGLITILVSFCFLGSEFNHPNHITFLPVLGCALILTFGNKGYLSKFIENKFMLFLGTLSYSIYLWHQPIFVYQKIQGFDINIIIYFLICITLSFFTWFIFERNKIVFSPKKRLFDIYILASFILLISFSVLGYSKNGFEKLIFNENEIKKIESFKRSSSNPINFNELHHLDPGINDYFLIGDSIANQFSTHIQSFLQHHKIKLYNLTRNGSIPLKNFKRCDLNDYQNNQNMRHYDIVKNYILNNKCRNIIYTAAWPLYIYGDHLGLNQPFEPLGNPLIYPLHNFEKINHESFIFDAIRNEVSHYTKKGKRVFIIGPYPYLSKSIPMGRSKVNFFDSYPYDYFLSQSTKIISLFSKLSQHKNVFFIRPDIYFKNNQLCNSSNENISLYHDRIHLSDYGSKFLMNFTKLIQND